MMVFRLMEVRGLVDACLSLKMSKRTYTPEYEKKLRIMVRQFTKAENGFVIGFSNTPTDMRKGYAEFIKILDTVAKYGAGVGLSADIDAGHETILRFIDFSVMVHGLHRGAQDDLDSHAMRMNNRIVRASSRLTTKGSTELSDWYKDKIIPFNAIDVDGTTSADHITRNGEVFIKTASGFVREDLLEDKDALRGLYPLGMASDCIFKVNLYDMRHIYMRRNSATHAAPELKIGIEQLADQIENALPCNLGKLIRNDYCADGELHHISQIEKVWKKD